MAAALSSTAVALAGSHMFSYAKSVNIEKTNNTACVKKYSFSFQIFAFRRQMSAFQELKREIRVLEKIFHPKHELFRVKANGLDELCCRFVGANGDVFVIHCNIYVS